VADKGLDWLNADDVKGVGDALFEYKDEGKAEGGGGFVDIKEELCGKEDLCGAGLVLREGADDFGFENCLSSNKRVGNVELVFSKAGVDRWCSVNGDSADEDRLDCGSGDECEGV